ARGGRVVAVSKGTQPMRTGTFLVAAAILCSFSSAIAGAQGPPTPAPVGMGEPVAPFPPICTERKPCTLAEFDGAVNQYCASVASSLNASIAWHLVLDVSGSFRSSLASVSDHALQLVRSLPLQPGDT